MDVGRLVVGRFAVCLSHHLAQCPPRGYHELRHAAHETDRRNVISPASWRNTSAGAARENTSQLFRYVVTPSTPTGPTTVKPTSPAPSTPSTGDGTQVLRRAAGILRTVAQGGAHGTPLADIARTHGLARSTAHRILRCLAAEGFLEQGEADKRYRVGPLLHELGMAPGASAAEIARWRPVVEAVAQRTGVTAYLMRRSGVEAVCLVKADGRGTIRFVPVEVGQRRLLGVGAGATALLAALPPDSVEEVIRTIAPGLSSHPRIDPASLRAAVHLVRQTGFAMSQGTVVDHGFGLGMAVPDAAHVPQLALSIAAHGSEVTESAISAWKRILRDALAAALAAAQAAEPAAGA